MPRSESRKTAIKSHTDPNQNVTQLLNAEAAEAGEMNEVASCVSAPRRLGVNMAFASLVTYGSGTDVASLQVQVKCVAAGV